MTVPVSPAPTLSRIERWHQTLTTDGMGPMPQFFIVLDGPQGKDFSVGSCRTKFATTGYIRASTRPWQGYFRRLTGVSMPAQEGVRLSKRENLAAPNMTLADRT